MFAVELSNTLKHLKQLFTNNKKISENYIDSVIKHPNSDATILQML